MLPAVYHYTTVICNTFRSLSKEILQSHMYSSLYIIVPTYYAVGIYCIIIYSTPAIILSWTPRKIVFIVKAWPTYYYRSSVLTLRRSLQGQEVIVVDKKKSVNNYIQINIILMMYVITSQSPRRRVCYTHRVHHCMLNN